MASSLNLGGAGGLSTRHSCKRPIAPRTATGTGRWRSPRGDRWWVVWACSDHLDAANKQVDAYRSKSSPKIFLAPKFLTVTPTTELKCRYLCIWNPNRIGGVVHIRRRKTIIEEHRASTRNDPGKPNRFTDTTIATAPIGVWHTRLGGRSPFARRRLIEQEFQAETF